MGMPIIKKVDTDLWEIRCRLDNKIARIIFTFYENFIVLLHGFIKKTPKISTNDLKIAKRRLSQLRGIL